MSEDKPDLAATARTIIRRGPYKKTRTLAERLERRLVRMPSGCLEWTGFRMPTGHGQIGSREDGRLFLTHRLAWILAFGPIPAGLCVRHYVCDNPPCCEPSHLRLGTHAQNMADMKAHGRGRNQNTGKTYCPARHEYTAENTYTYRGKRYCKECGRARVRARRLRGLA